ncbi:MAG TPA: EAL domain-containing protein [Caulobacteraceae bacterium]|jgi:EAL domain-containing protein (putative c-di-GMP-specific phosphodiesterase class I)
MFFFGSKDRLKLVQASRSRDASVDARDLDRAGLQNRIVQMFGGDDLRPVFVASFGIDDFDRFGAAVGSASAASLVRALAQRLAGAQPDWSVAGLSQESCAAAFHAGNVAEAEEAAETMRRLLEGAYPIAEHTIDLRITAGLSDAGPPAALLQEADLALHAARADGVSFRVFDAQAHARAAASFALMPELRNAMRSGELWLAHQPKYDLRTGEVTGVETLVRWTHPRHGEIPPDVFVRLAEASGDIDALTRWVIERLVDEQAWVASHGFKLSFAANLSGRLLGDEALIDWLIARHDPAVGGLRIEITETAVIANSDRAFANVARLAAGGVPCSIDDYGSGLSSLSYLKRIEADELKLDKSLVDEVSRSGRDALVTRSTIELAHSLGMRVVAEGVEDPATAAIVSAIGCDLGQGYFYNRPVAAPALLELLRQSRPAAEAPASAASLSEERSFAEARPLRQTTRRFD